MIIWISRHLHLSSTRFFSITLNSHSPCRQNCIKRKARAGLQGLRWTRRFAASPAFGSVNPPGESASVPAGASGSAHLPEWVIPGMRAPAAPAAPAQPNPHSPTGYRKKSHRKQKSYFQIWFVQRLHRKKHSRACCSFTACFGGD